MLKIMFYDWLFEKPDNATTFIRQLDYINSLTDTGAGGVLGIAILFGGIRDVSKIVLEVGPDFFWQQICTCGGRSRSLCGTSQ